MKTAAIKSINVFSFPAEHHHPLGQNCCDFSHTTWSLVKATMLSGTRVNEVDLVYYSDVTKDRADRGLG